MNSDAFWKSDQLLYLEKLEGDAALKWVESRNNQAVARLKDDPNYRSFAEFYKEADRLRADIAYPAFATKGKFSNFHTDDVHLRGVLRETDRSDYFAGKPQWQTILDIDELAQREGRNWTYAGTSCLPTDPSKCLLLLSEGGKDAVTVREFDLSSRTFVSGGFELPEAKQDVSWLDADTIYVSREWDKGDVTESGYAYISKALKRGCPLDDATEIFRGQKTDVHAYVYLLYNHDKEIVAQVNTRSKTSDETCREFVQDGQKAVFPLPLSAQFVSHFDGQIIMRLKDGWTSAKGKHYPDDSLISFDLSAGMKNPEAIEPLLIFTPMPHQSLGEVVNSTRNRLLVEVLSNVSGTLHSFRFHEGRWESKQFDLPGNSSVSVISADDETDGLFLTVEGALQPTALYRADAASMEVELLQTAPALFDASNMEVVQHWATSKDGTRVPYFMVSKKGLAADGNNPTLIHGYGGFEVSLTPHYLGTVGKIWLENGGVYVLANIRGGGEFGKKWHEAGLKTKRQAIYDDFQAIAEDLIARKVTSPEKLGISGGSNGGLLTGVQLVQRPELWKAVIIAVPLLDMMRYHLLFAGASWMGEYGDPDDPVEGAFLRSISPYHNLKAGKKYPEPLLITSRADDRVHPAHARKMAARMDEMDLPNLFFESDSGGHSGHRTSDEEINVRILEWVYLTQKLMN